MASNVKALRIQAYNLGSLGWKAGKVFPKQIQFPSWAGGNIHLRESKGRPVKQGQPAGNQSLRHNPQAGKCPRAGWGRQAQLPAAPCRNEPPLSQKSKQLLQPQTQQGFASRHMLA